MKWHVVDVFMGYGIWHFLNTPFDLTEEQYQTVCRVQMQMRDSVRSIITYGHPQVAANGGGKVYGPYLQLTKEEKQK